MFISRLEKEEMRISIRTLQTQVKELQLLISSLNKPKAPTFKTAEAPWGYKADGTPKKRPGRPRLTMKVGSK